MPSSLDDSSSEWSDLELVHLRSTSRRHANKQTNRRQKEEESDITYKPSSRKRKKGKTIKYDNRWKQGKRDRSISSSSSWTSSFKDETCTPKSACDEVIDRQEYLLSSGSSKRVGGDISLIGENRLHCVERKNRIDDRNFSKLSQAYRVQRNKICEGRSVAKTEKSTKRSQSDNTKKFINEKQGETIDYVVEPCSDSALEHTSNISSKKESGRISSKDRDRSSNDSDRSKRHSRSRSKCKSRHHRKARSKSSSKYHRNKKDTNRSRRPSSYSYYRLLSRTRRKSPSRQASEILLPLSSRSDYKVQTTSEIQPPPKSRLESRNESSSMQPSRRRLESQSSSPRKSFCGSSRRSESHISLQPSAGSCSPKSHFPISSSTAVESNGNGQTNSNSYFPPKFPVDQQIFFDLDKVDSGLGDSTNICCTAGTAQPQNEECSLMSATLLGNDTKAGLGIISEQGHKKIEIKLKSSEIKDVKPRYAGQTSSVSVFGEWKPVQKSTTRPDELLAFTELCKRISNAENGNSETTDHNSPDKDEHKDSDKGSSAFSLSIYRHPFVVQPKPAPAALTPAIIETPAQAIVAGIIIPTFAPLTICNANLQSCFPVSSGQEHRKMETNNEILQNPPERLGKNELEKGLYTMGFFAQPIDKGFMHSLEPVRGGFGEKLLQKLGWQVGQPLGKRKEGFVNPIEINIKFDRKGLSCCEETLHLNINSTAEAPQKKSCLLSNGKHPVSFLMELCTKQRWAPPDFELILDEGPSHRKDFLFQVTVGGTCYQAASSSRTKKEAKAMAALAAAQSLIKSREDLPYLYQ